MKKIIVIGCPGSGKTTFAEKLCAEIRLPLFYLDAIWHRADRTHISREEFDTRLGEILALESWIIDGNYSRTLERRIAACDTVFLFDLPTEDCLAGAISRIGKTRTDMPWVDAELDPWLKNEIENFKTDNLPDVYALLGKYGAEKQVVIFKSREEADEYIRVLQIKSEENNMKRVYDFLKKAEVYYLATMDGNQPRVRPFGTINEFEGRLYVQTGKVKPTSRQLAENPKAEICAFCGGEWIRVACELVDDDRIEAKKSMLDAYPNLRGMYNENDGNTQVFYMKNATATFSSFGKESETVEF